MIKMYIKLKHIIIFSSFFRKLIFKNNINQHSINLQKKKKKRHYDTLII